MYPVIVKSRNCIKSTKSSDLNDNLNIFDVQPYKIWPIVRNEYRKIAYNAYKSGDENKAILYDCKGISCGFIGKMENADNLQRLLDDKVIEKSIYLQQNSDNKLFDVLSELINNISMNQTINSTSQSDEGQQFDELCTKCAQLPKEWNVIQISQLYNGYNRDNTVDDRYTSNAPIKITMLRDSLTNTQKHLPYSITLGLFEKNLLLTAYKIRLLYAEYTSKMHDPGYSTFIRDLTEMQTKMVTEMIIWLGPWMTLLCGQVKDEIGKEYEKKIFKEVDKFCNEHNLFDDQRMFLNLIARRIDLLNTDIIEQAANDIAINLTEYTNIVLFLIELKMNSKSFDYYPCILIIDEILDSMPWEMVLTDQEFTRVHSIYLLFDLYERFKDRISNGYMNIATEDGFALINPDHDEKLIGMDKRMTKYLSKYFPKWPRFKHITPTLEQMMDNFKKTQLFVYSGHGSSTEFLSNIEFKYLKHDCLMMLFACASIAMKTRGGNCEATCSSYVYFQYGVPGILGTNTIVTDIWIDLITILLLSQWITSNRIEYPNINDTDENTKERVKGILQRFRGKQNPNLLQILCDIRNEHGINIRIRSAMIFRGLPLHNKALRI